MLCYVMLCYAMLCYVMLCYFMFFILCFGCLVVCFFILVFFKFVYYFIHFILLYLIYIYFTSKWTYLLTENRSPTSQHSPISAFIPKLVTCLDCNHHCPRVHKSYCLSYLHLFFVLIVVFYHAGLVFLDGCVICEGSLPTDQLSFGSLIQSSSSLKALCNPHWNPPSFPYHTLVEKKEDADAPCIIIPLEKIDPIHLPLHLRCIELDHSFAAKVLPPIPPLTHLLFYNKFAPIYHNEFTPMFPLSTPLVCLKVYLAEVDYAELPRTLKYLILPHCTSAIYSQTCLPPSLVMLELGDVNESSNCFYYFFLISFLCVFFLLVSLTFSIAPGCLPRSLEKLCFTPPLCAADLQQLENLELLDISFQKVTHRFGSSMQYKLPLNLKKLVAALGDDELPPLPHGMNDASDWHWCSPLSLLSFSSSPLLSTPLLC